MPYQELVDTAWRFYDLGTMTAEILGWGALIIGSMGYAMTQSKPARCRQYKGLILGGAAGLGGVLLAGNVYRAVTLTMINKVSGIDHETAMYPQQFLDAFSGPMFDIVAIAGVLSQVAAVIGMAAVSFGTGFWGVTKRRSLFRRKAVRIIYGGIALMVMSVCERIMAGAAYVFVDILP